MKKVFLLIMLIGLSFSLFLTNQPVKAFDCPSGNWGSSCTGGCGGCAPDAGEEVVTCDGNAIGSQCSTGCAGSCSGGCVSGTPNCTGNIYQANPGDTTCLGLCYDPNGCVPSWQTSGPCPANPTSGPPPPGGGGTSSCYNGTLFNVYKPNFLNACQVTITHKAYDDEDFGGGDGSMGGYRERTTDIFTQYRTVGINSIDNACLGSSTTSPPYYEDHLRFTNDWSASSGRNLRIATTIEYNNAGHGMRAGEDLTSSGCTINDCTTTSITNIKAVGVNGCEYCSGPPQTGNTNVSLFYCGDGQCACGEDGETCPADCPPPTGTITSISPNPCNIAAGNTTCTSTINYNFTNLYPSRPHALVCRNDNGSGPVPRYSVETSPASFQDILPPGTYDYSLRTNNYWTQGNNWNCSVGTLLDTEQLVVNPPPPICTQVFLLNATGQFGLINGITATPNNINFAYSDILTGTTTGATCSATVTGCGATINRSCYITPDISTNNYRARVDFIPTQASACSVVFTLVPGADTCNGTSATSTYSWQSDPTWGPCISCSQSRNVWCLRSDGIIVADSFCNPATKPTTTQACGRVDGTWSYAPPDGWGNCSANCGGGIKTKTCNVQCGGTECTWEADSNDPGRQTTSTNHQEIKTCNTQACSAFLKTTGGDVHANQ